MRTKIEAWSSCRIFFYMLSPNSLIDMTVIVTAVVEATISQNTIEFQLRWCWTAGMSFCVRAYVLLLSTLNNRAPCSTHVICTLQNINDSGEVNDLIKFKFFAFAETVSMKNINCWAFCLRALAAKMTNAATKQQEEKIKKRNRTKW